MTLEQRMTRYLGRSPNIAPTAFVAPSASLVGDVTVGDCASIWYNTVLRGDIHEIKIGPYSNIQDGTVVHLADDFGTYVGQYVTCGHKAMLHACKIDDECLIGMGAIILDGAEIGARSIIGAGALVTKGAKIAAGSLVLGSPAKVVRQLSIDEQKGLKHWADKYVEVSRIYLQRGIGAPA